MVGIVRSRTKATEFMCIFVCCVLLYYHNNNNNNNNGFRYAIDLRRMRYKMECGMHWSNCVDVLESMGERKNGDKGKTEMQKGQR
jgi:hypothetical protein